MKLSNNLPLRQLEAVDLLQARQVGKRIDYIADCYAPTLM